MTNIMIVTGGTGGHITPAIALAEKLISEGYRVNFLVDKRFANFNFHLPREIEIYVVSSLSPFAKGIKNKIRFLFYSIISLVKSVYFINYTNSKIVISFGGYMSFPGLIAAILLRKKIIIHEQNSVLGRANNFFASKAHFIATSFEKIFNLKEIYKEKTIYVGKLVRKEFIEKYQELEINNEEDFITILVTGGSQAAKSFTNMIPRAIGLLEEKNRKKIKVIQQCREDEIDFLISRYKDIGVQADIAKFFPKIYELFAKSQLIIARSGSSTIAEITVTGKASILIPLPNSVDNHQLLNAKSLLYHGTAWCVEENEESVRKIYEILDKIVKNPEILNLKSELNKQLSINGPAKIINLIEELI